MRLIGFFYHCMCGSTVSLAGFAKIWPLVLLVIEKSNAMPSPSVMKHLLVFVGG